VVDDLLLYAQLDAGTADIARQCVRLDLLIEAAAPEDLELQIEGGEIEANVDPNLFAVLLRNLFANATRHGNAGDSGVRIQISAHSLIFQDSGPGFPEKVLSQIESGLTFVSSRGGIGLGLTILRLIAEQHQGEISLSNAPEGGARFEFRNF
jgi:signal transduction histidine kinase